MNQGKHSLQDIHNPERVAGHPGAQLPRTVELGRSAANNGALAQHLPNITAADTPSPSSSSVDPEKMFIVMRHDNLKQPHAIVRYAEDVKIYRDLGHKLFTTTEASMMLKLLKDPRLHTIMDDHAWASVSAHLAVEAGRQQRAQERNSGEAAEGLCPTPLDLPIEIAEMRLAFLGRHPDKRNAQMLYEVIEVIRVANGKTPLYRAQFSQQSRDAEFWAVIEHTPISELHEQANTLRHQLSVLQPQVTSEDANKSELARAIDARKHHLEEISHLLLNHPFEQMDDPNDTTLDSQP